MDCVPYPINGDRGNTEGGPGTSLNKPSKIQDSHNVWLPGPITEGYEVVKGEGRWRLPRLIIQLIEAQQLPICPTSRTGSCTILVIWKYSVQVGGRAPTVSLALFLT